MVKVNELSLEIVTRICIFNDLQLEF